MKHTKFALVVIALALNTGCETGKSGAEISDLGESLVSGSQPVAADVPAAGPAIDYNPRTATTYAAAVSACQTESRALCSRDQLLTANQTGDLEFTYGVLASYWMVQEPTPTRNTMQILNGVFSYIQDNSGSKKFYCCL